MNSNGLSETCNDLSVQDLLNGSHQELAAKLGCSGNQLSRTVQIQFGYSLAALRLELRLLQAAQLLRRSRVTVALAAELCGFANLELFDVCFQRRLGMAPAVWQQRPASAGSMFSAPPQISRLLSELPEH
jgi:transcriptional regulator GlxA family with amidase domain